MADILEAAMEFIVWPVWGDEDGKPVMVMPPTQRLREWIEEYDDQVEIPEKIRKPFLKRLHNSTLWQFRKAMKVGLDLNIHQFEQVKRGELPVGGIVAVNYVSESVGRNAMSINTLRENPQQKPTMVLNGAFQLNAGPPPKNRPREAVRTKRKLLRQNTIDAEYSEVP